MSESMPMLVNSATANSIGGGASGGSEQAAIPRDGGFTALLQNQMDVMDEQLGGQANIIPAALLKVDSDQASSLASEQVSGNDLPLQAAIPGLPMVASVEKQEPATLTPPANLSPNKLTKPLQASSVAQFSPEADPENLAEFKILEQSAETAQRERVFQQVASKLTEHSHTGLNTVQQATAAEQPLLLNNSQPNQSLLAVSAFGGGTSARAEVMVAPMPVAPQHPQWNQALGERLQWMVGQNMQQADIRLDPPELGALEVRVQIHKDQANIMFAAPNHQVREAVEAAVPRLRDMFGEIGLSLGDVNVSQESFTQKDQQSEQGSAPMAKMTGTQSDDEEPIVSTSLDLPRRGEGLLDTYV